MTLKTMRSTYFHMLFTNRCMDYEFRDDMTLRKIYEYGTRITPLAESPFGNQNGINGFILTKDGYVLLEKRDHKKITWKDKFAQSISLAMKESSLYLNDNNEMDGGYEAANKNLRKIITKTIEDNFGLKEDADYDVFDIQTNFLGLARDLLEGGKPNLYFYVVVNRNARELANQLKEVAARDESDEKALKTEKLSSDYYLVPYEDIKINFKYVMKLDRTKCIRVRRHVHPRSKWTVFKWEEIRHAFTGRFDKDYRRECGEAFLVTLSYLELCEARIDVINRKKRG